MFRKVQLRVLLFAMETLEKHPLFTRLCLRPIANAPFLSRRLMVLVRAFMGSTAFEIHDVDLEGGRIGIGGVNEIIFGAKIAEQLHAREVACRAMGAPKCVFEIER